MKLYQIYYSNTMYSVVVSAETIEEAVSKFRALSEKQDVVINAMLLVGVEDCKNVWTLNRDVNLLHKD